MVSPSFSRASPSNTMNRHGVSLPWSGTREATVSRVASSSAVGPGPLSSIGLTERREVRRSMASGMVGRRAAPLRFARSTGRGSRQFNHPGNTLGAGLATGLKSPRFQPKTARHDGLPHLLPPHPAGDVCAPSVRSVAGHGAIAVYPVGQPAGAAADQYEDGRGRAHGLGAL